MATSKIVLTDAQMGFVTNAVTAISGILSTEKLTVESIKGLKDEAKKAVEAHRVELNLNLKGLKLTKFKFTGTAKTNPAKKMILDGFKGFQSEGTAMNSLACVVACYNGEVGGPIKYHNGLEVSGFNLARLKTQKVFHGLLDGKKVEIDRDDVTCANALIKAMGQSGFELVARKFIKGLGTDDRRITGDEITATFQNALTESKLAIVKDGKVVPK
jgi:hypothetical protein